MRKDGKVEFKVVDPRLDTFGYTVKMERVVSSMKHGKPLTFLYGSLVKDAAGRRVTTLSKVVYPIGKLELA